MICFLQYCQRIALVIYCWWTPERTNVFYLICTIIIICRIKIFNRIYSTVKKLVNEPWSFATSLESNMILLHVCNCCFKVWGKFVMSSRLVDSSWPVYSFFEVYCTGVLLDAVLNSTWRKKYAYMRDVPNNTWDAPNNARDAPNNTQHAPNNTQHAPNNEKLMHSLISAITWVTHCLAKAQIRVFFFWGWIETSSHHVYHVDRSCTSC